jgi:uncharacterized membrane protein
MFLLKSKSEKSPYAVLSFVATLLRVVGAVVFTLYFWATVVVVVTGDIGNTTVQSIGPFLVTERLIGGLAGGILAFAFGELLRGMRDISLNTRRLYETNKTIVQLLEGWHENAANASPRDTRIVERLERVMTENGNAQPLVPTEIDTIAKNHKELNQSTDISGKQRAQSFANALAFNWDNRRQN